MSFFNFCIKEININEELIEVFQHVNRLSLLKTGK